MAEKGVGHYPVHHFGAASDTPIKACAHRIIGGSKILLSVGWIQFFTGFKLKKSIWQFSRETMANPSS